MSASGQSMLGHQKEYGGFVAYIQTTVCKVLRPQDTRADDRCQRELGMPVLFLLMEGVRVRRLRGIVRERPWSGTGQHILNCAGRNTRNTLKFRPDRAMYGIIEISCFSAPRNLLSLVTGSVMALVVSRLWVCLKNPLRSVNRDGSGLACYPFHFAWELGSSQFWRWLASLEQGVRITRTHRRTRRHHAAHSLSTHPTQHHQPPTLPLCSFIL